VISPIIVNDNVVDLLITPGAKTGDAAMVKVSPDLGLVRVVNELTTGTASPLRRMITRDSSGVIVVRVTGTVGAAPLVMSVNVDDPTDFAERAFALALRERGIAVSDVPRGRPDFDAVAASYSDANRVAEHVSLPLAEEIKVILKVSQNLHASSMPYIVGAIAGKTRGRGALQAGFEVEREFLQRANLDLIAASQGDGAGGSPAAFYSPNFMTQYLAYMATRADTSVFRRALPILGRDGTLWNIQPQSSAAGHVVAKTGTFGLTDPLNRRSIVLGKGLAGYMTTSSGRRLAFAIYANRVPFPPNYQGDSSLLVGQALGEIAAAAYELPLPEPARP
jgi:D-alanyl-D-alanine carboxypeptidase/D-alanyl-D-alanine-endopeptidase (penicillin-binding protein 4)